MLLAKENFKHRNKLLKLKLSDGWVSKLLSRHGLKSRRMYGEASSVPGNSISSGRHVIRTIIMDYSEQDVFNFDETACYYRWQSHRSITSKQKPGKKQNNLHITVALATNVDGSYKVPLLFVGVSKKPRCFTKTSTADLGVEYASTKMGWMTSELFNQWITHFDKNCERTRQFLPQNTTAILQPLDSGIIRSFKVQLKNLKDAVIVDRFDDLRYLSKLEEREIDEDESKSLYNVDLREAMKWARDAWNNVTLKTIRNCWRKTGIYCNDNLPEDHDTVYKLVDDIERMSIHCPSNLESILK
ncbi:hypothetical protein THRCLA_20781 [Thraustotheca clavata]|uniref:DDE-1 domain-containing protein n=1 Tax=Thraustotheca clavata TaxID=74557 RepID=A0A1W0A476_9STRA|nr:hypothetical protein THRCLA_20781 [Thraustotheca clavata]